MTFWPSVTYFMIEVGESSSIWDRKSRYTSKCDIVNASEHLKCFLRLVSNIWHRAGRLSRLFVISEVHDLNSNECFLLSSFKHTPFDTACQWPLRNFFSVCRHLLVHYHPRKSSSPSPLPRKKNCINRTSKSCKLKHAKCLVQFEINIEYTYAPKVKAAPDT